MPSDLSLGGWQPWPRRETVVSELEEAQANGEDPASALIEIFREGPELLSEYRSLRSDLYDAYQNRRRLMRAQSNAADTMRQASKDMASPRRTEKHEKASERWDELQEEIEELNNKIEDLETKLGRTARRYGRRFFEVEDSKAVQLQRADQIKAEATR